MAITYQVVKITGSGVTSITSTGITTSGAPAITISSTADSGITINKPTDSKSNDYGTAKANLTQGGTRLAVWEKDSAASGASHTFTVTYSGSTYPTAFAVVASGVDAAAYDSGSFNSGVSGAGNPFSRPTLGQAQALNGILTFIGTDAGSISSFTNSNAGFSVTQEIDTGNYWCGAVATQNVNTTAAVASGWSVNPGASNGITVSFALKEATGGGDVTAALTGVAGTGGVGTVSPATSKALTGNAGTSSVGTVSPSSSKALTGNAGTGGVGTVGRSVSIGLSGVSGTGAVGSVSAGSDATAALTGVAGTGSVGSVSPASSVALTGVQGSAAAGTVVPSTSKAISGNAGTGSVGSVGPAVSRGVTGNEGTASAGSVGPNVTVALSGVSGTGAVGTVTAVTGGVIQDLTGVEGTGSVGSVGIDVVIGLTGVSATGLAGDVSLPSSGGGRDDSKRKIRKRINELNKKILQAEAEEAQEITQTAVAKAKSAPKSAPTQGFDEDEEEALMLLL